MASKGVLVAFIVLSLMASSAMATDIPFRWGRPQKLVGTQYESETAPVNGGLGFKPITAKVGDTLVVTYNLTPHELVLGTRPGDQSLGIVAPEGPGGSVHNIPLTKAGSYVISDIQKGSDGVPYWKGYNAYLPITVT